MVKYNRLQYVRKWQSANRERTRFLAIRRRYEKLFGITIEEADDILERGCECCGSREGKLCIDHDHATGKIRGCLCNSCNLALGYLKDSPELIVKLLTYIKGA